METPSQDCIDDIAERLDGLKFGAEFTWDEVRLVAGYLLLKHIPAKTVIIQEGRRATSLGFIVQGTVTIQKEDIDAAERHIIDLSRDTVIGEIAFFDNEPRSATVVAKTDVTVLVLTREQFDIMAQKHPHLAIKVLFFIGRILGRRLRHVTGRYVGLLA